MNKAQLVIGNGVKMGNASQIYSNIVIGSKEIHGRNETNPVIGSYVIVGAGTIVLEDN